MKYSKLGTNEKRAPHIAMAADHMQHDVSTIRTPIAILLRCSCGWSRQFTRHQNALARAAKVKAAKQEHEALNDRTQDQ